MRDWAIKFNGCGTTCPVCKEYHRPDVGYQVTLRDTMDIVCEECVEKHASHLGDAAGLLTLVEDTLVEDIED